MSRAQFQITRADGRSNATVIIDLVKDAQPGTVFPYADMITALNVGAGRAYTKSDVCQTVRIANIRLLKQHRRELYCLSGEGFKVAHASQHNQMALARRTKADKQIERGMLTIRQARFEEMDENSRKIAEGTLLIMAGIHQQLQYVAATTERHDRIIEELLRRTGGDAPLMQAAG